LPRSTTPEFPPGFEFPITDIALKEMKRVMKERRWNRAELSRQATKPDKKITAQTVSNVLNRTYPKSKEIPALLKALGLPLELVAPGLTDKQRLVAIRLRELGDEMADAFLLMLEGMRRGG
jgi:lambda repressor-like predicted transcriptional regulator